MTHSLYWCPCENPGILHTSQLAARNTQFFHCHTNIFWFHRRWVAVGINITFMVEISSGLEARKPFSKWFPASLPWVYIVMLGAFKKNKITPVTCIKIIDSHRLFIALPYLFISFKICWYIFSFILAATHGWQPCQENFSFSLVSLLFII